jgi:phage baseplate assembly protein gpV
MSVTCTETEISASAEFTVNAPQINLNGAISGGGSGNANASFSGDVIAQDVSLVHHVHSGVQSGGDNTGEPV